MAAPRSDADRMREVGLFDLRGDLASLLRDVAAFFDKHHIASPVRFEHRHDRSRGWLADLELTPADFLRVLVDYPMPVSLKHLDTEGGAALVLSTDLRAGTLSTVLPLDGLDARVTADGLLISG